MPRIIVTADPTEEHEGAVMLQERIAVEDLRSQHFSTQLVERVGWAVEDAHQLERERARSRALRPPGPLALA